MSKRDFIGQVAIFDKRRAQGSRRRLTQPRRKGAWRPQWLVISLAILLTQASAYAVCFGELLTAAPAAVNTLPQVTDVSANTEHPGTVRGGLQAETLIDPANPPPEPGSDPAAAANVHDPGRAAAGTTNIGTVTRPRIVGTESVAELTHFANTEHGPAGTSPFVDGHMINGDYYGNNFPDDRNFVTLTAKANAEYGSIEQKVKSMTSRLRQVYHDFGYDQTKFCAHTQVGGTQVSYKPVVHVRSEVSLESVRQFEATEGNPNILFLDLDPSLTPVQQAAAETKITEGMPAWIELKITLYMEEYQLNPASGRWEPQQRYSVMPEDVANNLFRQKTTSSGTVKRNFLSGAGGLSFEESGGGAKIQYEYVSGVGPQVKSRVYNRGPLNDDLTVNGQDPNSNWPPGITYP